MSKIYLKPPIDLNAQLNLLKERKLIISDEVFAKNKLNLIGYYHLSSYFKSFQNVSTDLFKNDSSFDQVITLYAFDRKLKLYFFDAIERVEISLKALLSNELSMDLGAYWFEDRDNFIDKFDHEHSLKKLSSKISYLSTKEGLIKDFYLKYSDTKKIPPSWIFLEVLSFGEVLTLFRNLKRPYRQRVSSHYGFDESIIISWFVLLNDIRNICAHHGRLWNRNLKKVSRPNRFSKLEQNGNFFNSLLVIVSLLKVLSPYSAITEKIIALIQESSVNIQEMGFPENWESFVQEAAADS